MPTELRCLIDDRRSYAVVHVIGTLDPRSAVAVRRTLLKCLAEQPRALLVDLSGMHLADRDALSVFLAVAGQAAMWPGVPLVLCGPRRDAARLLVRRSLERCVPVVASVSTAVRAMSLGKVPVPPSITEDLLPIAGASRRAREVTTEACLRWDLPALVGPACTVVTELVNNAVTHAHTMMRLHLALRRRHLHAALTDGSTERPLIRRDTSVESLSGRGLWLVETVAAHWGSLPIDGGKVVWAMLALPDSSPENADPSTT